MSDMRSVNDIGEAKLLSEPPTTSTVLARRLTYGRSPVRQAITITNMLNFLKSDKNKAQAIIAMAVMAAATAGRERMA